MNFIHLKQFRKILQLRGSKQSEIGPKRFCQGLHSFLLFKVYKLSPNIVCLRGHGATGAHTISRYSGPTWRIDDIGFCIRVIIIIIVLRLFPFEVHLLTRRVHLQVLLRVPPLVLPLSLLLGLLLSLLLGLPLSLLLGLSLGRFTLLSPN